jgi:hypothetical protein
MTTGDAEYRWNLIRDLWNQLELNDVLARDWPIDKRWQLDLLFTRMRAMDEMVEDYAFKQLMDEMSLTE